MTVTPDPHEPPGGSDAAPLPARTLPASRTGVICNRRSHLNRRIEAQHAPVGADVLLAFPKTPGELTAALADFAERGIDLLVIDGGDGTVRDVLTAAADMFGPVLPRIAVLPMGKTNALALDLGVPLGWSLDEALAAAREGDIVRRAPLEIWRAGQKIPEHRGFLIGAGGFVRATELAQSTHRAGAFNGVAVALALCWAVLQTLFGRKTGPWRRGEPMRVAAGERVLADRALYLLLASTLEYFPLGLKPLGPTRPGLKTLLVEAPPRWLLVTAVLVLLGKVWRGLGFGFHDEPAMEIALAGDFILDGEHYAGGDFRIATGVPLEFVVP